MSHDGTNFLVNSRSPKPFNNLVEAFKDACSQAGDTDALVYKDKRITYRDLDTRTNQVARHLQSLGINHRSRVGIFLNRGTELVGSILSVLKTGAAYLPLDPSYPQERIKAMLDDANVSVIITREDSLDNLPETDATILDVFRDWDKIAKQPKDALDVPIQGDHIAYVIFTSGSTGRPKGVEMPHKGVLNLVSYIESGKELAVGDRCSSWSSTNFDASICEIFPALLAAGTLHILPEELRADTDRFAQWMTDNQIQAGFIPPFMLKDVLNLFREMETPPPFKRLIVGVEPIDEGLLLGLMQRLPELAIVNGYGPTEACVFCTAYWVDKNDSHARRTPIGKGIEGMDAYLLNTNLNKVEPEETAEIFISGTALARGYLGQPAQTAARFLPNPYAETPGARMYTSGDLARWLPSGDLLFVGRQDHQVKVRGHRIELGEIESILEHHPQVSEAAVILKENPVDSTQKDLRAYVAPILGQSKPEISDLRDLLHNKLPSYMHPTTLMILDEMPRTPAGKVDRRNLPEPERQNYEVSEDIVLPNTPTEEILCGIWSDVLGVEQVGIHDSIFDLGAHSLSAIKIMARSRDAFQLELTPAHIFSNPTVKELGLAIDMLQSENEAPPTITVTPRGGPLPVSFPQERVWYLETLSPGLVAYNTTITLRFRGPLKVDALEKSFTEVLRRHEILRTTFHLIENRPVQVIHDPWTVKLPLTDLSHLDETAREAAGREVMLRNARTPFDLGKLPLITWELCKMGEDDYLLVQVENHVVHDGWSFSVLMKELKLLYVAYANNEPSPIPDLAIQFGDFAVWQREWMSGQVLENQLDFWRKTLADMPALLRLPTDNPRPRVMSFEGSSVRMDIPDEMYVALKDFSRANSATLFMTMYTAFLVLIHRYSGLTDIFVGSGVANRRFKETEPLIGMMLNNIILRTDCTGNPDFKTLLSRACDVLVQAYAHQDAPFDKVVEALNPARDPSYAAFTQVFFSFHDSAVPELSFPGIDVELEMCQNESAKFDMNIVVIPRGEQLSSQSGSKEDNQTTIIWEYCTALYRKETIAQLLKHYIAILKEAMENPMTRMQSFQFLDDQERLMLTRDFNPSPANYPREATIDQLFNDKAQECADQTALVFEDTTLTYAQVNQQANQLAHYLRAQGITAETRVGISLERSPQLIIGLLAILKAGGVYVPLDPSYPADRFALIRKVSGVSTILTVSALAETIPEGSERILLLDELETEIAAQPTETPRSVTSAESQAYVMFTSGSTGTPKGVSVVHRGVVRLVRNNDFTSFDQKEVFFHMAPVAFDASTFEIWGPLLNGASLVIMPPGPVSIWNIVHTIRQTNVTTMWLTASLFNQFVDAKPENLPKLKYVLAGGDILSPSHVRQLMSDLPGVKVINGYGPTECVTFSCCHPMSSPDDVLTPVSIGRSINHSQVYVLDSNLELVPKGVYGDLYIGGDGLARGYLDQPQATALKFIPNPYSETPGDRLYTSGDIVRYRNDGLLEFAGRSDQQVKLRGHRIELGEIEAALNHHPAIRESVVTMNEEGNDKNLVAYLKPLRKGAVTVQEVRNTIKEKLPEYMVPSFFVFVDALALSATGKINRNALPAINRDRGNVSESYVAPRSDLEKELVEIWQELLKQKQVGVRDNFFELGGHSLLATQLVSRVRATYGVHFPLISLLEEPTIDDMAVNLTRLIEAEKSAGNEIVPDVIEAVSESEDALLAQMEDMSEEELNAALADMLDKEED